MRSLARKEGTERKLIDGHIHIERGNYSIEWINEFVEAALERGISAIYLLEHSMTYHKHMPGLLIY